MFVNWRKKWGISEIGGPKRFLAARRTQSDFSTLQVDGDDLGDWIGGFGKVMGATRAEGDANLDDAVDGLDFRTNRWKHTFVPVGNAQPRLR